MGDNKYQCAKNNIIDGYTKFINSDKNMDEIQDVILNSIIPNFRFLACDIDDIIESINSIHDLQIESMDYIECLFNQNLYNILIEFYKQREDSLIHYAIILVEMSKYNIYKNMCNKLDPLLNDEKVNNMILIEGIKQASIEKKQKARESIESIYNNLITNYPTHIESKDLIDNLFSTAELDS